MSINLITPPPARAGGTFLYCPMVDVAATERAGGQLVMCAHPRRRNTANGRRSLRRHFRRGHLEPFQAETDAMLRWLANGHHFGMRGARVELKATKGSYTLA